MSLVQYTMMAFYSTRDMLVNLLKLCQRKLNGKSKHMSYSDEYLDEEIALQAKYICEKYMQQKFGQRDEYNSVFKSSSRNGQLCNDDAVRTMKKFGRILEKSYPKLYTDVVQQLNFRINYGVVICGLFTCVCDNILAEGITWAKIVSMYAFAAALATDCYQADDVRTARNISNWMGQYTRKRLARWIRSHGGWDGFVIHFDNGSGGRNKWFEMVAIMIAGLLAITTLCIIILHAS